MLSFAVVLQVYAEKTIVQSSGPALSHPTKVLYASNQKADRDSYRPSAISPGIQDLAVTPEAFARNTARCGGDVGVYGSRGIGAYT